MPKYTSVSNVSSLLNGLTINGSTTPSSTAVEQWIDEAESYIDTKYGTVFSSTAVSNELYDHDGSDWLRLANGKINTITTLEINNEGLNEAASWTALTEGEGNDYIYYDDGEILFISQVSGNRPNFGYKNIRVSYNYGDTTTPPWVVRLATLRAAKQAAQSFVMGDTTSGGGSISVGNISVTEPSNFGASLLRNIDQEIEAIESAQISSSHVYRPKRDFRVSRRW